MAYRTLLFDLDGTLTDPLLGFMRSINYALEAFGFDSRGEAELRPYIGPPLELTLQELTQQSERGFTAELVAKYRERYLDVGYAENSLYPDVVCTLQALQEAGQRMAVCTSKPERTARLVLQLFELEGFFQFVSGGDVGVEKWMQIEQLLAERRIDDQALMIGDRAVDLIAGHRNNIHSAGVLWGYGSVAELQAQSPTHLFGTPSEWLLIPS